MKNRHLYVLSAILAAVGLGFFLYKVYFLNLPLRPGERVVNWEVQARINFEARNEPVTLSLFVPQSEGLFTIVDQSFVSEGYGVTTVTQGANRRVQFSIRKASGKQTLYYRFIVNRGKLGRGESKTEKPDVRAQRFDGVQLAAARNILRTLEPEAAGDETLVRLLLQRLTAESPDDDAATLLGPAPNVQTQIRIATRVLAMAAIPARMVTGLRLVEINRTATPIHWLEAYTDGEWQGYAPQTDTFAVPNSFLPWWRGASPLANVTGGIGLHTTLSVAAASEPALRMAVILNQDPERNLLDFSLFTLPLDTQHVYKIILTVPLGVLFLTLLRNVVGLRTFGTFMPILIALAFRETNVVWGVVLFTTVTAIGLLVRLYLENLRLLMVPRLSSVLIVVLLSMAGISVLSHELGFERGLSVSLFPMVILTMTVERMSIVWDERGPVEMLRLGINSLIVAIVAYFIIINPYAEHLVLVFPELLLVLLSINLLLGRYSGFRLLDLPRFRVLAGRPS